MSEGSCGPGGAVNVRKIKITSAVVELYRRLPHIVASSTRCQNLLPTAMVRFGSPHLIFVQICFEMKQNVGVALIYKGVNVPVYPL